MQDQPIRVGIVGSRYAADFHYAAYGRVTGIDVRVVGVTSNTAAHREQFASQHGIEAFDNLEAMLDHVDVVDNCTPGYAHESVSIKALQAGKHLVVEKPFTGYFGPADQVPFSGETYPKADMLEAAMASAGRIVTAARNSGKKLCYAENWIYAPAIQKEAEVLAKTKGQILWALGDQSHSGSPSPAYGVWRLSGGGAIMGKSCHPMSAILYLKQVEGLARSGAAIRPASVSARTHAITRNEHYIDAGFLRTDYDDVEDYGQIHLVFEDGMVADVFASEIVMGGVHNRLEIYANNHRARCNLSPNNAMELYNPEESQLEDVYVVEKIGTKQGWTTPAVDESLMFGYPQEIQDFMEAIVLDREPKAGAGLAVDTVAVMYAAYLSAERNGAEVAIPKLNL